MDKNTYEIRMDIQQWCKEDQGVILPERRERIIQKAMEKYGLSHNEAEDHFNHNRDFD